MDEIEDTQVGRYTISITHIRTILDSQCNKRSPSDHSSCPRVEMTDRIISASIPPTHSATVINGHTDAEYVSFPPIQHAARLTQIESDGLSWTFSGTMSEQVACFEQSYELRSDGMTRIAQRSGSQRNREQSDRCPPTHIQQSVVLAVASAHRA